MSKALSKIKVQNIFKGTPFQCFVNNNYTNGAKTGCSGFIFNSRTNKVCYISSDNLAIHPTMEFHKNIMMRKAKNLKDYTGGMNIWISADEILKTAERLTREE